jgi:hypothetical protein
MLLIPCCTTSLNPGFAGAGFAAAGFACPALGLPDFCACAAVL